MKILVTGGAGFYVACAAREISFFCKAQDVITTPKLSLAMCPKTRPAILIQAKTVEFCCQGELEIWSGCICAACEYLKRNSDISWIKSSVPFIALTR